MSDDDPITEPFLVYTRDGDGLSVGVIEVRFPGSVSVVLRLKDAHDLAYQLLHSATAVEMRLLNKLQQLEQARAAKREAG